MQPCSAVIFSGHALRRMFERSLSKQSVLEILSNGEAIAEYPNDQPYPSVLLLGWVGKRAVHVVVAQSTTDYACYVITAYYPSSELWSDDFRVRR